MLRTLAILILGPGLAMAGTAHDESVNGDLSTDPSAPTAVAFSLGGNTVTGVSTGATGDKDYLTFTVPTGYKLTHLNLLSYSPANIGFAAFNSGNRSYEPTAENNSRFLAGIHADGSMVGTDLLPVFATGAVTANSLAAPELGPGEYCFLFQQGSIGFTTSYSFEFVLETPVPTTKLEWSALKARYLKEQGITP